ncbi:hypothetical protein CPB85DRAFT_1289899 [Mucidula mucida]|nr:hypothetical protein CPB85DRAFT_1289899 [Mucidula mucida]
MPKSPPLQAEAGPSTTPQSTHELFQYTITNYSTCWIRDIMTMEHHPKTKEFFMLGRVPCRNVEFVDFDDGTAVIECVQRKDPVPVPSPTPTRIPPPVAEIGRPVRITGKVFSFHETKRVQVNTIERVQYNDEPIHWKRVRNLHETDYDLKEPFVVPRAATPEPPPSSTPPPPSSPPPPPIITKLRDPARLHTADLTPNTFRMYVQHYMKHAAEGLGFTLSHLRRVPVLAALAKRVVKATHRALRKTKRETPKLDARQLSTKMKQLFVGAIRELNFEGNILLWEGPVAKESALEDSALWKTQAETQDVTAMTTILGEDAEVSEPEEDEEAYVPTDAYLRDVVMAADVVRRLKRDSQWEFIGDWHVDEALEGIGTVYKVRGGWRCCE